MAQYIDKDALVAEIERLRKYQRLDDRHGQGVLDGLHAIERFINTLEEKEVDLEEYYHDFLQKEWFDKKCNRTMSEMMAFAAKHFFELGMSSTITEEDCKLIWNIGDGLPCMKEEDFFKELLRRYKAQKGEQYDRQRNY